MKVLITIIIEFNNLKLNLTKMSAQVSQNEQNAAKKKATDIQQQF